MKRIIAILLSLTLTIGMIGCGKKNDPQAGNNSNTDSKENVEISVSTSDVTFSKESKERVFVETEAKEAIDFYLVARMYLDKFLQYDIQNGNEEEYNKLLNETIVAFENVQVHADDLFQDAEALEGLEADASYNSTDGTGKMGEAYIAPGIEEFSLNPFLYTVYAAEESEAVKWAKDITEKFDKAPVGKGIRTLAEQLGTDAQHAYAQLTQAQEILKGNAYENFAETANEAYKTAKVLKTAGTAAQLTLSIMTAEPSTTFEAVMTCGGILVNGFNTILEVGSTGSVLVVGNDTKVSQKFDDIEDALAPIGSAIGLYSLSTNLAKGVELADDVPAIADSMMYIGTSLYDYVADGKILGGTFVRNSDGSISCSMMDTEVAGNSEEKIDTVLKNIGYSEEEIAKVKESKETQSEKFDSQAEISGEIIDKYLEGMSDYLPEPGLTPQETNQEDSNTNSITDGLNKDEEDLSDQKDNSENDMENDEKDDVNDDEDNSLDEDIKEQEDYKKDSSSIDISEIEGTYNFYLYMTLGEQSAEGEAPNTVKVTGPDTIELVDVDGIALKGTYDSTTGKAVLYDSEGPPYNVTFTRNSDGSIKATIRMYADGYSVSGSGTKR